MPDDTNATLTDAAGATIELTAADAMSSPEHPGWQRLTDELNDHYDLGEGEPGIHADAEAIRGMVLAALHDKHTEEP